MIRLVSKADSLEVRTLVSDRIREGVVVLEQGWGSRLFDPVNGGTAQQFGVNRNSLVPNSDLDPLTSVPALNGARVRIETLPL